MRNKLWGGVLIVLGITGIGLGIWLFMSLGLDEGDKLASVVGMFVGVVALGVSIYGVALARRDTGAAAARSTGGTSITGSVIGGGVSTITDVAGPVTIRRRTPPPGAVPPPAPGAPGRPRRQPADDLTITDSTVAGRVDRIRGAGSVEMDE
ncbi:hypothetical protein IU450_00330 [Nocardia abscessus]|uniref:hypothetical protein n=1 Tax=Nocardia abscessus TaxID=120957 RepID=UPI00189505F7|nr:hypothetical protein [Nocardia abscessus]MBF6334325.1 hypothetical protein [Nocardia abscessus]